MYGRGALGGLQSAAPQSKIHLAPMALILSDFDGACVKPSTHEEAFEEPKR
jgi:hypothetical protein